MKFVELIDSVNLDITKYLSNKTMHKRFRCIANKDISLIDENDIRNTFKEIKENQITSYSRQYKTLDKLFKYAIKNGYINKSPLDNLEKSPGYFFNEEEIVKLRYLLSLNYSTLFYIISMDLGLGPIEISKMPIEEISYKIKDIDPILYNKLIEFNDNMGNLHSRYRGIYVKIKYYILILFGVNNFSSKDTIRIFYSQNSTNKKMLFLDLANEYFMSFVFNTGDVSWARQYCTYLLYFKPSLNDLFINEITDLQLSTLTNSRDQFVFIKKLFKYGCQKHYCSLPSYFRTHKTYDFPESNNHFDKYDPYFIDKSELEKVIFTHNTPFYCVSERYLKLISNDKLLYEEKLFKKYIYPLIGQFEIGQIDQKTIDSVIISLINKIKYKQLFSIESILLNVMNDAYNTGLTDISFRRKTTSTYSLTIENVLNSEEIQSIYNAAAKLKQRDILEFIILTSIGDREAISLRWEDYNPNNSTITIRYTYGHTRDGQKLIPVKKNKQRTIFLSDKAKQIIEKQVHSNSHPFIFTNANGLRFSVAYMSFLSYKIRFLSKIPTFSFNYLQISQVFQNINKGINLTDIFQYYGYASPSSIYRKYYQVKKKNNAN